MTLGNYTPCASANGKPIARDCRGCLGSSCCSCSPSTPSASLSTRRHIPSEQARRGLRNRLALVGSIGALVVLAGCHSEQDYDGRPIASWYGDLRDTSAAKRAHAAEIIAQAAPDHPESVERLLAALESESDSSLHVILANALGDAVSKHGPSPAVFTSLVRLTSDDHQSVRTSAAIALARVVNASSKEQPIAPQVSAAFTTMFLAPDDESRAAAADAIGAIALVRPADVTSFAEPLGRLVRGDASLLVRLSALEAFVRLSTSDEVAIPVYASALHDGWPAMQSTAVKALARSPRVAGALADSIVPLVKNEDIVTRVMAIRALAGVENATPSSRVVAALQAVTADRDSTIQAEARSALKTLGVARK